MVPAGRCSSAPRVLFILGPRLKELPPRRTLSSVAEEKSNGGTTGRLFTFSESTCHFQLSLHSPKQVTWPLQPRAMSDGESSRAGASGCPQKTLHLPPRDTHLVAGIPEAGQGRIGNPWSLKHLFQLHTHSCLCHARGPDFGISLQRMHFVFCRRGWCKRGSEW